MYGCVYVGRWWGSVRPTLSTPQSTHTHTHTKTRRAHLLGALLVDAAALYHREKTATTTAQNPIPPCHHPRPRPRYLPFTRRAPRGRGLGAAAGAKGAVSGGLAMAVGVPARWVGAGVWGLGIFVCVAACVVGVVTRHRSFLFVFWRLTRAHIPPTTNKRSGQGIHPAVRLPARLLRLRLHRPAGAPAARVRGTRLNIISFIVPSFFCFYYVPIAEPTNRKALPNIPPPPPKKHPTNTSHQVGRYLAAKDQEGAQPAIPAVMWLCVLGLFLGACLYCT